MTTGISAISSTQDRFTQDELFTVLKEKKLERGQFLLDVSDEGTVKLSQLKRHWVQRTMLLQEGK